MKLLDLLQASFMAVTVAAGTPSVVLAQAPDTDMAQKVANLRQLFDEKSDSASLRIGVMMVEDDYTLARRGTDPIGVLDRIEESRSASLVQQGGAIVYIVCRTDDQKSFTLRRDISFANLQIAQRLENQAITDEDSQQKRRQERASGGRVRTPAEFTFVISPNGVFEQVTSENAAELQERLRSAVPVPVTRQVIDRAVTQHDAVCGLS